MGAETKSRILYIEDEPDIGDLFKTVIEDRGYVVDVAECGAEGIELHALNPYDVIAVDYQLPDMTGIDVCRKLLLQDRDLPIMMVTGKGSERLAAEALSLGVTNYVAKDNQSVYLELIPSIISQLLRTKEQAREKTRTVQALRDKDALFEAIFGASQNVIAVTQISDGKIKYCNAATTDVLGYKTEDVIGRQSPDFYHDPKDRGIFLEKLQKDGFVRNHEVMLKKEDGSLISTKFDAKLIDIDGEQHLVAEITDLTEHKLAEEKIRAANEEREVILRSSPAGILFIKDRKIIIANLHIEKIFGWSIEELNGQSTELLFSSTDEFIEFGKLVYPKMISGEIVTIDHILRRKDNSLFWCRITEQLVDNNDLSKGVIAILDDISDQVETERELKFQKLALDEHAIVSITDVNGEITYANDKFCNISGYTREELLGQNHRILKSEEHTPEFYDDLWETISNGEVWSGILKNKNKGGGYYWVNATIVPFLNDQGEPFQYVAIRTDITDRIEAEHSLTESEAHFRAFLDHSPVGMALKDTDGRFILRNPASERIFGVSHADSVGKTADELFPKELAGEITFHDQKVQDGKITLEEERLVSLKDGEHTIRVSKFPILDAEEKLIGTATIEDDITNLRRATEELQASQMMMSSLLDNTQEGYWNFDNEGLTVDVNPAMCNILGRERDEIIGKNIYGFVDVENTEILLQQLEKRKGGAKGAFEIALQQPDGTNIYCLYNATPVFDDKGVKTGSIGLWTEISELKKAEYEIKEQNALIQLLHSASTIANEAIKTEEAMRGTLKIICDSLGWPVGHIYRFSSDGSGRMVSSGIWHLKDARKFSTFRKITEQTGFASGEGLPGRVVESKQPTWIKDVSIDPNFPRSKHAKKIGVRGAIAIPVLVGGETAAVLEFFSPDRGIDVSEDLKNALLQIGIQLGRVMDRAISNEVLHDARTQAEIASRSKSEFLSSMSHELRTPMNAILGFAQMLDFNPKEPLTDTQKSSVNLILKGGDHLLDLIDQVLELSKIEAGKMSLEIDHVPAGSILDECLILIQGLAEEKGIEIIDRMTGNDLPLLWTDSTRLQQVLLNLLSNAIKYNKKGGTVTLTSQETPNQMLRFRVADTGSGIPVEKQDDLFEPFERLGREAGEIEGTGIGLTISKQIIELLGGQIGYESRIDKGSTFWIDVPLSIKQVDVEKNTGVAVTNTRKARQVSEEEPVHTALYIEDNPDNIRLMETIFDHVEKTRLLTAYNAELGLDLAKRNKPDLILMDINLPGMNGIDALKKLQETKKTREIPVIAITAAAMSKEVEAGMKAGFKDYITKPINVVEIIRTIEEILHNTKNPV